jgi:hypothetical protein
MYYNGSAVNGRSCCGFQACMLRQSVINYILYKLFKYGMTFLFIYRCKLMQLALTSACGAIRAISTSGHVLSIMGPECSNNHKGSGLCIIANGHPVNSTECSTTPKWKSVIAQSADMHVSASYASSVQLGTSKHRFQPEGLQLHFSQFSAPR